MSPTLAAADPALAPIVVPAAVAVLTTAIGVLATALATGRANDSARALAAQQNEHARVLAREEHDRALAAQRQQRVDDRRADAYHELLADLHRMSTTMARTYPLAQAGPPSPPPIPQPSVEEDEHDLSARITAYGSKAVDELLWEWSTVKTRFSGLAWLIGDNERRHVDATAERLQLEEIREEARAVMERIDDQVRSELRHGD